MRVTLRVWRQASRASTGRFEVYDADDITSDMSLFEVLDLVNERLSERGEVPIAFDSDCREGICGTCGIMVDGVAHGPSAGTATCQLHMRSFRDGATILLEPFRAAPFPLIKDLVVDRSALDRIIRAGGYITVHAGAAPEANAILVPRDDAEDAMDAAACIGCGACVAACPNGSASLFTGSKITHLGLLPQGQPERGHRALDMVQQMDAEGFGGCTWHGECEAACPKRISIHTISRMHREYIKAVWKMRRYHVGLRTSSEGKE